MNCNLKKSWIQMEMEHTSSKAVAKRIVQEHIKEHGCKYYPQLIKLERRLKNSK